MFGKYIDINSTRRNRDEHVNTNDFKVRVDNTDRTATNSRDPVANSTAYKIGLESGAGASTASEIILGVAPSTLSDVDSFYVGDYLQIDVNGIQELRRIIDYDGGTLTATVDPYTAVPTVGTAWKIRKEASQESYVSVVAEETKITTTNNDAHDLNGDYWLLNTVSGAQDYFIWYNSDNAVKPTILNRIGIEVVLIVNETANDVALKTQQLLDGLPEFNVSVLANDIFVSNVDAGNVTNASVGTATSFAITVTQQGLGIGVDIGSTTTQVVLNAASSSIDDYYNNMYIHFTSGTNYNLTRRITAYDGATRTATVSSLPSAPFEGDSYDINRWTHDNEQGLIYNGSISGVSQYCDYQIKLTELTIPNLRTVDDDDIYIENILDLPFVYVEFGNLNNNPPSLYSNNPACRRALFKVPINVSSFLHDFITLECEMIQIIKYRPDADHRFRILTPDGRVLRFGTDTLSPMPPLKKLQTSATFCINKWK